MKTAIQKYLSEIGRKGGHVAIDDDCAEHVALAQITSDEERLFGVEV